jgi:hypothetical protein
MCIFVPTGHLNAGTAAASSIEEGSVEELISSNIQKPIIRFGMIPGQCFNIGTQVYISKLGSRDLYKALQSPHQSETQVSGVEYAISSRPTVLCQEGPDAETWRLGPELGLDIIPQAPCG